MAFPMNRIFALAAFVLLLALPSGFLFEILPEPRDRASRDARARHEAALTEGGTLAEGVLALWREQAETALRTPLPLALPYAERLSLPAGIDPGSAQAFELRLAPPDVLHVVTAVGEGARGGLLVDVLQERGALGAERIASFGSEGRHSRPLDVRWVPPVAGDYLVRVQPLVGSVGAFGFALARRPPLDFPVATDALDAVRSLFGDARDGGRREHHGIDIFAARGTPVLAAADGVVARVGNSARGGLHVWQRAEDHTGRSIGSLYYAHLDTVATLAGTRVARGDVLGTVGNTGNARTTPPHLHFGLYQRFRGPVDPLPYVGRARVPETTVGTGHVLAPWLAVASPALNLRSGPETTFDIVGQLAGGALVGVLGVSGDWVRVRTHALGVAPLEGFVSRALLEPPASVSLVLAEEATLLAAPAPGAPELARLAPGTGLEAVGTFGAHRLVVTKGGRRGWLALPSSSGAPEEESLPDG